MLVCACAIAVTACTRAFWSFGSDRGAPSTVDATNAHQEAATVDQLVTASGRGDLPPLEAAVHDVLPADRSTADRAGADNRLLDIRATNGRPPDGRASDSGCTAPSASCWDVNALFSKTDFELAGRPPKVLGQSVTDGQRVYALLTDEDDTYSEPDATCSIWSAPKTRPRVQTWHIERKRVSAQSYRLLVRGQSAKDCGLGQPSCAGEINVNGSRGWTITQTATCSVHPDNADQGQITTYCTVDEATGKITWQSGSTCGGCCACPDGAGVSIEVVVTRS